MGERIGRYELERKLAVGGMAEVWLARAQGPGGFSKQVVVKRVLQHLASEPQFAEMFLHEAALVARLDHPNIVQLFDFGEHEGTHYLAMEYVDGPSLKGLLKAAKAAGIPFPIEVAARVVAQACEGMAYAHDSRDRETGAALGLVHRDISPDNILLSRAGAVKVADFGIAKSVVQRHRTETGMVKGKVAYVSPEQLEAEPLDRRSDVYALGVVLYELLTGARPFDAKGTVELMRAVLSEPIVPVRTRRAAVPAEVAAVAERALDKDRERRFQDCREMQRALETWLVQAGKSVSAWDVATWMRSVESGQGGRVAESTPEPLPALLPQPERPAAPSPGPVVVPPAPGAPHAFAAPPAEPAPRREGVTAAVVLVVVASALVFWALRQEGDGASTAREEQVVPGNRAGLEALVRAAAARQQEILEGGRCGGTEQARALLARFVALEQSRAAAATEVDVGALVPRLHRWMDDVEAECSTQEKASAQWQARERWLTQLRARAEAVEAGGSCTATDIEATREALDEALRSLAAGTAERRRPPPQKALEAGAAAERLFSTCRVRRTPTAQADERRRPARLTEELENAYREGQVALKENEPGSAASWFRDCLKLDSEYAACWRGLGVAYAKGENPDDAARAYQRFLELAPGDPAAPRVRKELEAYERSRRP